MLQPTNNIINIESIQKREIHGDTSNIAKTRPGKGAPKPRNEANSAQSASRSFLPKFAVGRFFKNLAKSVKGVVSRKESSTGRPENPNARISSSRSEEKSVAMIASGPQDKPATIPIQGNTPKQVNIPTQERTDPKEQTELDALKNQRIVFDTVGWAVACLLNEEKKYAIVPGNRSNTGENQYSYIFKEPPNGELNQILLKGNLADGSIQSQILQHQATLQQQVKMDFIRLTGEFGAGSREPFQEWFKQFQSLAPNVEDIKQADLKNLWDHFNTLPKTEENRKLSNNMLKAILVSFSHEWGLQGEKEIDGQKLKLEGSYGGLMHANLAANVSRYLADKIPEELEAKGLNAEDAKAIQESLNHSVEYSVHSDKTSIPDAKEHAFNDFQDNKIVTLGAGWRGHNGGHNVEVTLYKNKSGETFLVYTNRGEKKRGEVLDDSIDKMKIFKVNGEVTKEILAQFMDRKMENEPLKASLASKLGKHVSELTEEDIKKARMEFFEGKGPGSMHDVLKLEQVGTVEKSEQKVGNCTWANAKGGFHACILLKMMERAMEKPQPDGKLMTSEEALERVVEPATALFKDWEIDHRLKEMEFFLSLEPAVRNGEVDMKMDEYYSMVVKLSEKLAVKGKFDRYQDSKAFPDAIRQKIGEIEQKVQECMRKNPIPLTSLTNQRSGRPEFPQDDLKPGSFMIWNKTVNYDGDVPQKELRIMYIDAEGAYKEKAIPSNCTTTENLLRQLPELKYPVKNVESVESKRFVGKTDNEVFESLITEGKAFANADLAKKHLESQPEGTYAIFPSTGRPGKFCVQFKLQSGNLSKPKILLQSKEKKQFALESFVAGQQLIVHKSKVGKIVEQLEELAKKGPLRKDAEDVANEELGKEENRNNIIVIKDRNNDVYNVWYVDLNNHICQVQVLKGQDGKLTADGKMFDSIEQLQKDPKFKRLW